ncbi:hypothetical protein AG0111_0g3642 [Alternaria gaisen]|uniref:Uncharacterized protein n=1 Tax=Alternaria gaisen TaxID=167740 RepID=A0ACB6FUE3_9PLEO|nr:hypothetical protein AG0111_0g3642 [Alternaria gaisen]
MSFIYSTTFPTSSVTYYSADATRTQGSLSTIETSATKETNEQVFIHYGTFSALPFIVRFKQEELGSATTTGSVTATGAETGTNTGGSPTKAPSDNSLSTAAKAGIGVGAALGAVILLGLGFFLYRRRATSQKNQVNSSNLTSNEFKAELHNETIRPKELDATHSSAYPGLPPLAPAELGTDSR